MKKKKLTVITQYIDEFHRNDIAIEKLNIKECTLHNAIYITFKNRQN